MADPVVSITSGVPTSGTGTITTLGQVVAPQGASTSTGESGTSGPVRGPLVQGATLTSAPTYTTGTVNPLTTTLAGALRVDGSGATQPISGTITANQGGAPWSMKPDGTTWAMTSTSANVNVTNGSIAVTGTFWQATQPVSAASLPLPTGAATSANQPTNAAAASTTSGQTGNLAMGAVSTAAPSYTTATSNNLSLTPVGALRVDGSAVTQPVSGTVTAAQATAANLNAQVAGDTTNAATDAGNPVKTGGRANVGTTYPTAVTNGQRVNAMYDKTGKQIVNGALREMKGKQYTTITTNTSTTVVTGGAAGTFNDVYAIVVTNTSATATSITFNDGAANQLTLACPAGDTRGFTVPVDSAIPQTFAAGAWTATAATAVTSLLVTMLFVVNT